MVAFRRYLSTLLVAASLAAACGGGGGGGGPTQPPPPPPPPPPAQPEVSFTPDAAPPASGLYLTASPADPLLLELRATGVTDLYGLAFDLLFPGALVSYDGTSEGTFFSAGDRATVLQVAPQGDGLLVVGITRLGEVPGRNGGGLVLTVRLGALAAGTGAVTIANNQAFDSAGEPLPGLTWVAGSVEVVM